jgi:hypothetical protein
MTKYILVNIGCIECGVSSNIVGVFTSKKKAEKLRDKFSNKYAWREGGQNHFSVFEMPKIDTINQEYKETK